MAVGIGVTEIADSEEELLTSSPAAVSDAAVDKLSAPAGQDTQTVACLHQEVAAHTANQSSDCTGVLGVNHKDPPTDIIAKHDDQPELHSIQQAVTDNASAFAVNTARQVDEVPQEIVRAAVVPEQGDRVATNKTNDRTGNSGDADLLPEDRHASELDERAKSQMSQQKRPSEPDNNLQYQSQKSPIINFGNPSVQQDKTSTGQSQGLALDGHRTKMELPQSDSAQSASDKGDIGEVHNVSNVFREGSAAAVIEALATKPGCNIACEATITSSKAVKAHYLKAAVAEQTTPDAVNGPVPMDLDIAPEAIDIVSSGEMADERKSATEPSAQHHPFISATAGRTPNTIKPATTSSGAAANAHDSVPASKTTDSRGPASEHHGHGLSPIVTALAKCDEATVAASNHLPVASSEHDRSNDHPRTASARPEATRCRSEIVVQGAYGEDQRCNAYGSSIAEGGDISSVAIGIQTESQSTASQASEPTSPFLASKLSPQEITLAELRAQKAALLSSLRVQPAIQVLMEENNYNDDEPTEKEIMAAANKIVKEHIKLLHEYNELKDVGQGLMGLIADQRGLRIVEIQDEFGIDAND